MVIAGTGHGYIRDDGVTERSLTEQSITLDMGSGDHIDAEEAKRIGLINDVLPDKESLMEEAFRLANRIALNSPETVAANKYIALLGLEMMGLRNAITTNWLLSSIAHSSQRPDYRRKEMLEAAKERGMRGFLEVRDAPFQPEPFGPRSRPRE